MKLPLIKLETAMTRVFPAYVKKIIDPKTDTILSQKFSKNAFMLLKQWRHELGNNRKKGRDIY